ncbi:MAG: DUF1729 domain-containing protein, partial [Ancrocorticia sp.]|nr:DUF1729 domain-containing protein [Ancrocorticia sp.]
MTFDMNDFRAGHPWVALFAGQSSPWRSELDEFARDARISTALSALERDAETRLSAVLPELTVIGAGPLHVTQDSSLSSGAFASVPGILLAQYAAYLDVAPELGRPARLIGHSQGVLAVALIEADDRAAVYALARLIGAAATTVTRQCGAERNGEATAMVSVRGVPLPLIEEVRGQADIAIVNSREATVLAGRPTDLARAVAGLQRLAERSVAERQAKRTGGEPLRPIVEYLDVDAPFHSHLLEPAVALVDQWCERCGLNVERADALARAVLTEHLDWRAQMRQVISELKVTEKPCAVVDFGPGTLQRIMVANLAGTGVTYINAGTAAARDELMAGAPRAVPSQDWTAFAPQLVRIEGRTLVETAFTRLTGRSPIILGGMTPTTVDPEIVAAAANAGHWVELAGGGQVTEEILSNHLAELARLLEPGRAAEFNAMFLDRYLWDLHFGARRSVSRERAAGAPLDGVTISAGIPDLEEAQALIARLRAEGFPYVAFKPGTVEQIRQVVKIAHHVTGLPLIIQIEDGHAGGHHSWVDLDELLLATYQDVRSAGIVVAVGGGLGIPERAATYLTGEWSTAYGMPAMPVDAVFIGTAAMTAREAKTNPDVKELLVATPGVSANDAGGWIASGAVRGGMTSGLSQLRADIYQVENSAAAAGRLLVEVDGDAAAVEARRGEIIAAINTTAKPFFGELEDMTYLDVLQRYVALTYPWTDPAQITRFHEMLHHFEARLCPQDHGEWPTLFPDESDVQEPEHAVQRFAAAYPQARTMHMIGADAAWFVALCRKYPKPVPFVPVIGPDILQWWGSDSLWQSQDPRYRADQVRIIPGPVSVAAITQCNEPVATILARHEDAAVARLAERGAQPRDQFARVARDRNEYIRTVPFVMWHGQLATNPAAVVPECELRDTPDGLELYVPLDTFWDGTRTEQHAVRELRIPVVLPRSVHTGGLPVVDDARLAAAMRELLEHTAGVGSTTVGGTPIAQLPACDSQGMEAHFTFAVSESIFALHAGVTAPHGGTAQPVPSALLGSCWPSIYAAIGSGVAHGYPVIEGLLSAVHLDHSERLHVPVEQLFTAGELTAHSRCATIEESSAGRVVEIATRVTSRAGVILEFSDRFAMRGRVGSPQAPREPTPRSGYGDVVETPRSHVRRITVTAPEDMTAFAIVSGDFNPIHTSHRAARIAGMDAPLVHGMWLCAAAQHAVSDTMETPGWRITGWTYRMFGMVNLGDKVEITVERTGRIRGGGLALEVTCRIGGDVVSQATAAVEAPRTAYLYPGQGIQAQGMALDERSSSPAAREVWERADRHTREALGFSILAVVRDNPTELTVRGHTYRHPQGVLNLTQFTQVALAVVAIAQTERLREAGALVDGAFFAGHSLGEYTALAAYGRIFTLENVLEIVFQRGSTMHHLVPRDERGRSNYRLGALRPNHMGLHAEEVAPYVASIARESGEFLEVVNLNLEGQQYAIAGTVAGLEALARDAESRAQRAGGKRPFMVIPGIDVPFHSSVLRPGVADFRNLLVSLLPEDIHVETLEGRYIPNLVARPFELTKEFCEAILEVVPADAVAELLDHYEERIQNRNAFARSLLVELLAWQFASPVRWIETQDVLIRSGVEDIVEVGLAASPTLANLAARTLALEQYAGARVSVLNLQRDATRVMREDVTAPARDDTARGDDNETRGHADQPARESTGSSEST